MNKKKKGEINESQFIMAAETHSKFLEYLKAISDGWLQKFLDLFSILSVLLVIANIIGIRYSEQILLRIISIPIFIFSFGTANYIAFKRLLSEKRQLEAKLQHSGPSVIPRALPFETGENPKLKIGMQNVKDTVALSVRYIFKSGGWVFSDDKDCIAHEEGIVTFELNRNSYGEMLDKLEAELSKYKEEVDEGKNYECWVLIEYKDIRQNHYQTIARCEVIGENWNVLYTGLAIP